MITQISDLGHDPTSWVEPSQVRLGFTPSIGQFLEEVKLCVVFAGGDTRLISVVYDRLPALEPLIEKILANLAEVSLALWPDWYSCVIPFAAIDRATFAFDDRLNAALTEVGPLRQIVSNSWVNVARNLCRAGRTPLTSGCPRAVQAAQLALTIGPRDLLIALSVVEEEQQEGRLLGLARAAEWLGRTTGARILVIVPEVLLRSSELDGINFDPIVHRPQPTSCPAVMTESGRVGIWPVIGRPHPYSPGEQLLARRLAADEMLGGLFQFNINVISRLESRFLVDLLWPEGRVVVEVDGYEYHSNRLAFSLDRRRDYELIVSGYLVLRLPHDEVMQDVEIAIEKIRDLVQFRRAEGGIR